MNKQKLTLFVLLIIFAISVVWSIYSFPRQKTVATLKYAPGQKAVETRKPVVQAKQPAKSELPGNDRVLHLELLASTSNFKGYKRNIFKPVFVDEVTLMKQRASAVKPVVIPQKSVPVSNPVQTPEQQIAKPEPPRVALARFTFLGFLQKDGKKTIFITKDKEILLVKNGERFSNGSYEVRSITDQALTILVVENGEEIVVPLLENKPLIAAK